MFDTTPNSRRKIVAAGLVVAIAITGTIVALSGLFGLIPKSASRWNPESPYGPYSADYMENRRDDVVLMWMCNCTLVNVNLTEYYRQFSSSAFVDGVEMRFGGGAVSIKVMFAPFQDEMVGEGSISVEDWELLSGSLVDDGIGAMEDANAPPDDFYDGIPFDLYLHIYFNDLTFLYIGYGPSNDLVCITSGTWTGQYWPNGVPRIADWDAQGVWLQEDGHLQTPIGDLYDAITQNVAYPSQLER